ncbi:MAG: ribonuclease P protein component [Planctomycetota bacterium]
MSEGKQFGLPRSSRLITNREFRAVYRRGSRARGRNMTVVAMRRRQPGHRVGLSVSKSHGPAVRRNKIKRLLREAFRLERPGLPGNFDVILIPQARPRYALEELREELVRHLRTLAQRRGERRRR